jgi:hypothetical protein
MHVLAMLLTLLRATFASRADLAVENLGLRHQIGVLRRTVKRPKVEDRDRRLWILLARLYGRWRECLLRSGPGKRSQEAS